MVKLISAYIIKTASLRRTDSLFVLPAGPKKGDKAFFRTISSWILKVIKEAYNKQGLPSQVEVQAHSTRGVEHLGQLTQRFWHLTSARQTAGVLSPPLCHATN